MTPLERKFREGGGGLIGRTIRGGGYGYFLEPHNYHFSGFHTKQKKTSFMLADLTYRSIEVCNQTIWCHN